MKYLELRKGRTNKASEGFGYETEAIKMFVLRSYSHDE